jgi:hypothetical protein
MVLKSYYHGVFYSRGHDLDVLSFQSFTNLPRFDGTTSGCTALNRFYNYAQLV